MSDDLVDYLRARLATVPDGGDPTGVQPAGSPRDLVAEMNRAVNVLAAGPFGPPDAQALRDRQATGCQYDAGLCACPSAPFAYSACKAVRR